MSTTTTVTNQSALLLLLLLLSLDVRASVTTRRRRSRCRDCQLRCSSFTCCVKLARGEQLRQHRQRHCCCRRLIATVFKPNFAFASSIGRIFLDNDARDFDARFASSLVEPSSSRSVQFAAAAATASRPAANESDCWWFLLDTQLPDSQPARCKAPSSLARLFNPIKTAQKAQQYLHRRLQRRRRRRRRLEGSCL